MAAKKVRTMRLPKVSRDLVLFIGGLLGILNEAFIHSGTERPYLLVLFAAMVGLPVFLYQDEHREIHTSKSVKASEKVESTSLNDLVELLETLKNKK